MEQKFFPNFQAISNSPRNTIQNKEQSQDKEF